MCLTVHDFIKFFHNSILMHFQSFVVGGQCDWEWFCDHEELRVELGHTSEPHK